MGKGTSVQEIMELHIQVIAKTDINFDALPGDLVNAYDYITYLKRMSKPDIPRQLVIENPGHLLRHISYTFGVVCHYELAMRLIQTATQLDIEHKFIDDGVLLVITGNLEEWRNVMLNDVEETRPVLNRIMILLELEGFDKLWLGYRKKQLNPESFTLIPKK